MFMIIIMFIKMVANCYIKCYNNELNKCCYSMETQVPISIICTSQIKCIYVSNSIVTYFLSHIVMYLLRKSYRN